MSHKATHWAISQRGLKPATKLVLWHLADCHNPANGCFPSQAYLADACEMSRSTLNVHLNALEGGGLISRVATVDAKSKRQRPTRYMLGFEEGFVAAVSNKANEDESPDLFKPCPESGHGTVSANRAEPCPDSAQSRVRIPDTNLVREPVKESCAVKDASSVDAAKEAFEAFWKAHPRAERKREARQAFDKAISDGTDPAVIVAAAAVYRKEQAGNNRRFVKMAVNWLREGRWADVPQAVAGEPAAPIAQGLEATAAMLVERAAAGSYVPPSAFTTGLCHVILSNGMASESDLRQWGATV